MAVTIEHNPLAERLNVTLNSALTQGAMGWLWPPLLRLLSTAAPVRESDLAAATGRSIEQVRRALADLPDTEYDEHGRLVGYGLTQRPTPHRFTIDGTQLYTWCALDTLLFPTVLDRPAEVASPCHATGTLVRLTVEPNKVVDVEPVGAVVSIVTPEQCTSVRSDFCNQVHFFTSPEAAQPWLAAHPGATVLPVAEAFTLGHQLAEHHISTDNPDFR